MKLYIIFIALFFNHYFLEAQNDFVISDVVRTDSINSDSLYSNAKKWIKQKRFTNIDTLSSSSLSGESWYYVYQKGIVTEQIHGKVTYKFRIEIKDGKYRYTFDEFTYHYLKMDRNLKMLPTGKKKPLTDEKAEGWQKTWDKQKGYTRKQIEVLINSLKTSMIQTKITKENKKDDF